MTDRAPRPADADAPPAGGERPDLGRTPDQLAEALSGSDVGSDTRAGSLAGGAATGSDRDPDQAEVNAALARAGRELSAAPEGQSDAAAAPHAGKPAPRPPAQGDEVEAPTG
ncbi:MAG TPA: ribonuclease [Brevundimonas sp.]|jgi:hypothetical protein|uniref:ribonuclease n=1 Tax=Brevundimonas sp. TaxID=1871086 RepID=UPI002E133E4D|nr:ribonuclease [Brevundimonas sp.]